MGIIELRGRRLRKCTQYRIVSLPGRPLGGVSNPTIRSSFDCLFDRANGFQPSVRWQLAHRRVLAAGYKQGDRGLGPSTIYSV